MSNQVSPERVAARFQTKHSAAPTYEGTPSPAKLNALLKKNGLKPGKYNDFDLDSEDSRRDPETEARVVTKMRVLVNNKARKTHIEQVLKGAGFKVEEATTGFGGFLVTL